MDLGVHNLRTAYRAGALTVRQVIDEVLRRIAAAGDDKVWISRVPDAALRAQADEADRHGDRALPLFGIPFAVKDNIDVAGLPTTAACPGYAYEPKDSAEVVAQLVAAGAIVIGKTNLDQFATGLVGVRSPYGVPRNPFNSDYIPGGSSSGSAVAVAAGLVSFSLGTDTAGSGRVPAGFNNIVGYKPTPGFFSNAGVVPACASLDCVSIFALSCSDAALVSESIDDRVLLGLDIGPFRFGVPRAPEFFGDRAYEQLYARAIERLEAMGGTAVPLDYAPFQEAARLLYDGPWVAERTAAVGDFIETAGAGAGIWPVTRDIVLGGRQYSAVDAFRGQYRLQELCQQALSIMGDFHFLALPTAGTIYTVADLAREPVRCNADLGHYTNFVNFFELSALALPAGFRPDGLPFGLTLVSHHGADRQLLEFGARWQRFVPLPLGRTSSALPPIDCDPHTDEHRLSIAVVGAHMAGLALNSQLTEWRGRREFSARTAPHYRLYALPGGPPQRPGLVRVEDGGSAIALEVWSLPAWQFGEFVAAIPAPLGLGTIELEDGSTVQGFVCEGYAAASARDITRFGGWRAYLKSLS
jgi:allophanate hydrolase